MKRIFLFLFSLSPVLFSCSDDSAQLNEPKPSKFAYHDFTSYADFRKTLIGIAQISDASEREKQMVVFFDSLEDNQQIPFAMGDSVALLYKGAANSVSWTGDFTGWSSPGYSGTNIGADTWVSEKVFPSDARLDYKLIVNGSWILDPANEFIQYSGFGPNSELRMPDWQYPTETILGPGVVQGQLSDNFTIQSNASNLNYTVQYKVYTPAGYESLDDLPVIYVTDGHEYANNQMGSMITVLDNIIYYGTIPPVIAVFIDPRNPSNLNENRRGSEYTANIKFVNFVADELVPVIDAQYKTNVNPDARAILGTSLGGWNSAFFGLKRSDVFQRIAIHSPAFDPAIIEGYETSPVLPLKIFMSTGVINDTQAKARSMKTVLEAKGYPLSYIEVNEGHSWGNWRALIEEPLVYFFGD
ncbi:MAG: alpha/beta hydrolase-fold protein [Cyclobacteriaceae bacterium]